MGTLARQRIPTLARQHTSSRARVPKLRGPWAIVSIEQTTAQKFLIYCWRIKARTVHERARRHVLMHGLNRTTVWRRERRRVWAVTVDLNQTQQP